MSNDTKTTSSNFKNNEPMKPTDGNSAPAAATSSQMKPSATPAMPASESHNSGTHKASSVSDEASEESTKPESTMKPSSTDGRTQNMSRSSSEGNQPVSSIISATPSVKTTPIEKRP